MSTKEEETKNLFVGKNQGVDYTKRKKHSRIYTLIVSLILIILGIILGLKSLTHDELIEEALRLEPGRKFYKVFEKSPLDTYLNVYFFNWTNPNEFYNSSKKPILKEIGPFRFVEIKTKENITFHTNNTVSFNRKKEWHFMEDDSPYNLDTIITTINPMAVSGARDIRDRNFLTKISYSMVLNTLYGSIATRKPVREMLFNGYTDPLFELTKTLHNDTKFNRTKFAWFLERNGSSVYDGHFNMESKSDSKLGQLLNWNYWNRTDHFPGKCGNVEGIADDLFPRRIRTKSLKLFSSDICRTIELNFVGKVRNRLVKGYEFAMGNLALDNGQSYPENECYCNGECVPYGMMNASSCRHNIPVFISLPHFYKADPSYKDMVEGMTPSEKHNFHVIFEPKTGLPLEVETRLQINILVKNVPGVKLLENIKDVFFPIFWFEEIAEPPLSYILGLLGILWFKEICFITALFLVSTGMSMSGCILYRMYKISRS